MKTTIFTSSFLITKLLLVFVIAEPRFHHTQQHREIGIGIGIEERDAIGCQKALGPGGLVCGDSTSRMCYDPTIGESCCPLDDSYCSKDQYCAPVAGFCCNTGEDVIACGIRQGFVPPPLESASLSAAEILPPAEPITVPIPTAATPISIALEPMPHVSLHLSVPPVNLVFSASQNSIEATSSASSPVEATPSPVSTGPATSRSTSIHHVSIVLPSIPPVNLVFSSTQKPTATLESTSSGVVHPSSTTTIVEQTTTIASCGGAEKPSSSPVSSPQGSVATPASPQYTGAASSSLNASAVAGLLSFLIAALLFVG